MLFCLLAKAGKNSPFDSVNKMYFLGNKTDDHADRLWLYAAIDDLHQAQLLRAGELSATVLKKKDIQYADVLIFKRAVLEELLHWQAKQIGFSKEVHVRLSSMFASHTQYRTHFPILSDSGNTCKNVATASAPNFSRSELRYVQLLEELVYGSYYDAVLKQILKFRKSARDALQYGAIGSGLRFCYILLN